MFQKVSRKVKELSLFDLGRERFRVEEEVGRRLRNRLESATRPSIARGRKAGGWWCAGVSQAIWLAVPLLSSLLVRAPPLGADPSQVYGEPRSPGALESAAPEQ